MSRFLIVPLAAATAITAAPSHAVSPEDVWRSWHDFLIESYGAELEIGSETMSGETLTVTDLTMTMEGPDQSVEAVVSELAFQNIGNGAVRITLPASIPIATAIAIEDDATGLMTMTMSQPGGSLVASGSSTDIRYDFDYPVMSLGEFTMTGTDLPEGGIPLTFDMTIAGLTGFMSLAGEDVRSYDSKADMDSLTVDVSFSDPEMDDGPNGRFTLTMSDLSQVATGAFGKITPGASLSQLVTSGTMQDGRATHGPVTYSFTMDGPEGNFDVAAAAESGELSATLGPDGLSYATTTRKVTATVGGSTIPLPPLAFSIDETGGLFSMPVVPGPDPQDFQLVVKLLGLTADDMLWSLFDPGGQLPRDAANLVLDLTGSGVLLADFTDPAFAEDPDNMEAPGELTSLTVNELLFSIAGARLAGFGDFDFTTKDGVPTPSGTATLSLSGGNKLIDTLVGMGLLPEEQAMGARMMLGLFARPDGDDQLISEIEVTEDGQILANGQRIR